MSMIWKYLGKDIYLQWKNKTKQNQVMHNDTQLKLLTVYNSKMFIEILLFSY